jgi:hypothetical protein
VASNGVKPWQARGLWGAVKVAAEARGGLYEGLSHVALTIWGNGDAGAKLSSDRSHREAFVASLVGAAAVDTVIDKLAEEGAISTPEAEFMRDLNAESALRDLGQFQKTANVFRTVAQFIAKNPTAVGTVAGAVAGGAFGAYSDDENRMRGAVRFALPGAVMGGMIGHGAGQYRAEELRQMREEEEKLLKATREAELHAVKLKELKAKARGW